MDNSSLLNSIIEKAENLAAQRQWDDSYIEINSRILELDSHNEGALTSREDII